MKIISFTPTSSLIVFQPQGHLDLQGGMVLKKQLASLVPQPQDLWVLDLAQVDFMDSSGLLALVSVLLAARHSGCLLVICNVQAPIWLIFELTQLDSVVKISESCDAVLTMVNSVLELENTDA